MIQKYHAVVFFSRFLYSADKSISPISKGIMHINTLCACVGRVMRTQESRRTTGSAQV